jgi:hypothetical protein
MIYNRPRRHSWLSELEDAMGYIFISYSHTDRKYVHRLAESLEQEGFNVWIDDRMDYGSDWPYEIQQRLDACDALILVMSPRSLTSKWVQNELNRALRKEKPIFPLMLEGNEPWLAVESIHYIDVSDGRLLEEKYYERLALVTPRNKPIVESKQQDLHNPLQESAAPPIIASQGTESRTEEKLPITRQAKPIEQLSVGLQEVSVPEKRISPKQKEREKPTSKRWGFLIVIILLLCTTAIFITAWLGFPWIIDQFKRIPTLTRVETSPSMSTPLPFIPTTEPSEIMVTLIAPDTHAATRIGYGNLITKEIKPSGNIDIYTFEGRAGDVAQITAAGTSDAPWLSLQIQAFDPQGKPISPSDLLPEYIWTNKKYELKIDGQYSFTVQDASTRTGAYILSLKNLSPDAGMKIGYGDVVEGEIVLADVVDLYAFDAKAGDQVLLALSRKPLTVPTENLVVVLVDEQGAVVDQGDIWVGNTVRIVRYIENNGKYYIYVWISGQLNTAKIGSYSFILKNISSTSGIELDSGATIEGTLSPAGDMDVYFFDWKFGEEPEIILEVGRECSTASRVYIEVFDLEGNSSALGSGKVKPSLTTEGTYTITIRDDPLNSYYYSLCDYTLSFNNQR